MQSIVKVSVSSKRINLMIIIQIQPTQLQIYESTSKLHRGEGSSFPSTPYPYINSTLTLNVLTFLTRNNLSARDCFLCKHLAPFLSMPSRLFSLHQVRSTCSFTALRKERLWLFDRQIFRLCFLPSILLLH